MMLYEIVAVTHSSVPFPGTFLRLLCLPTYLSITCLPQYNANSLSALFFKTHNEAQTMVNAW